MKPSNPVLQSSRLLDQLRECLRYRHYSLNTEKSYVYWVRFLCVGQVVVVVPCVTPKTWGLQK